MLEAFYLIDVVLFGVFVLGFVVDVVFVVTFIVVIIVAAVAAVQKPIGENRGILGVT
jgi:hypothetical protein